MEITINSSIIWLPIWECPVLLFKELELFTAKEVLTKGITCPEMFSVTSILLRTMVAKAISKISTPTYKKVFQTHLVLKTRDKWLMQVTSIKKSGKRI
jgi:hypothetical protein